MRLRFPIQFDYISAAITDRHQEIGRLSATSIWRINPNFRSIDRDRYFLSDVDIIRSNGDMQVNIELNLHSCKLINIEEDFQPSKQQIFKATLHHTQKLGKIFTNMKFEKGEIFRGHLSINCKRANESGPSISSKYKTDDKSVICQSKLSDDFLHLLDNPDSFADATLKCGTEEIRIHKGILSVRSPVLAAMFSSQMQEGLSSTAHITDIQPEVLKFTLRYIYGGITESLTEGLHEVCKNQALAGNFLYAADKYQLDELKVLCIDVLKSGMTVDNVLHILVLGELHNKILKAHAIGFLCWCKLFSEVEKTEDWRSIEKEYPSLAFEVVKQMRWKKQKIGDQ